MQRIVKAVFVLCAATGTALSAQTFTTLIGFDSTDGAKPHAGLLQATDGNFYGTTVDGGANANGTVFKITPSGTLTTLYSFCSQIGCTDGSSPCAGLVQASNGDVYGTTQFGGANRDTGTIFKITTSGTLTTLYSFCSQSDCRDGANPLAGLIQAANGELFGTTRLGGYSDGGTIFKITPGGVLTTLFSFDFRDGEYPHAGLVQAANGDLYGTTHNGGANNLGTVFRITLGGTLTTLYSFCSQSDCTDGSSPYAGLLRAASGDLYGTTYYGGANNLGTVFRITPGGTLTTLYSFCSQSDCTDGAFPYAALVQATNGDFYGTTYAGGTNAVGTNGHGTVFKITPGGTLTTVHRFCSQSGCTDGSGPTAVLIQSTNRDFYGTTTKGGTNGDGTVFSLSVGLP